MVCRTIQVAAVAAVLVLPKMLGAADVSAPKVVDTEKSVLTLRVFKAGFLSAFGAGHDHEIRAPIEQGRFTEENPSVELAIDARQLRVMDPGVSDKERAEVQETMLGPKVLDSQNYPEIRFRSRRVQQLGEGKWLVEGELTLHGQTRPIKADVAGGAGRYRGSAELKQKDFGITPVTIAGGAVKVKNEVRVEFEIIAK